MVFFMLLMSSPLIVLGAAVDDNRIVTYQQIEAPFICIDQIEGDQLIINDTLYMRSERTVYYDLEGNRANASRFKVGTCVKVKSDKEKQLLRVYEAVDDAKENAVAESLPKVSPSTEEKTPPLPVKTETIKNEGGVWRN
jgi:hypothetical protein